MMSLVWWFGFGHERGPGITGSFSIGIGIAKALTILEAVKMAVPQGFH